jgi:hypothetical protein
MLLLYGVAMRRESQVIGSRANLGYPSLRDYRYAANERFSFSDSLDQTADLSCLGDHDVCTNALFRVKFLIKHPLNGRKNSDSQHRSRRRKKD